MLIQIMVYSSFGMFFYLVYPLACYVSLSRRYERKVLPRLQILSMIFQKNYIASMSLDIQSVPIIGRYKKENEKIIKKVWTLLHKFYSLT